MKYYIGDAATRKVTVEEVLQADGYKHETVKPLRHIPYHSPDGFEWGYSGSGPTELARCILWDLLDHPEAPPSILYMKFRDEFIASLPRDEHWQIEDSFIYDWLRKQGVVI